MANSPDPDPPEPPAVDPALVTYLRRLVTVLTVVMIVGVLAIVGLLVSRLQTLAPTGTAATGVGAQALPEKIVLPDGSTPLAFTKGTDWYAVVTTENLLLIFDADTGDLQQTVQIE